jgi:hypothetical protein
VRWAGAHWRPIGVNQSAGTAEPNRLMICHIMQGTLAGVDRLFRDPSAQRSSHFGVGNDGTCYQWVDTDRMSWANCDANGFSVTVETEGFVPAPWTAAQVDTLGRLFRWVHRNYPAVALWLNTNPATGSGLSYHGLGGDAWCGHPGCPGPARVKQLGAVLARAQQ